jgi:hypothetical protein
MPHWSSFAFSNSTGCIVNFVLSLSSCCSWDRNRAKHMCMWSPTYVIILWPAEWHRWPTRLHELCNLAMHPNHQCLSYVEATYVPGWKGRIVQPWTTGTSMLHCLPMKWTSSPDTLLTFMSVWDIGTNEWLSRVPGMFRADTNRSSNNALWLSMSAAVT